ncbi:MAG TPA: MBG domain-containing protein, partial [Alphaproteobacteria bacterium]|nr:MBG domain-containing protein [Alphaproteobacteria bacterium]
TLTIGKRDITSSWTGVLSRTYGDANPTVTTSNFTYTGMVNGDTGAVVTASGNYGAITSSSNVGSYSVGGNFSASNYNITNAPTTTLTIGKRDITAAVNNASRAYGDANPSYTWADVTWSNLANSETGSVLDTMTLSSPTAVATSNAGSTHNIGLSGFSDNNYNLTGSTAGTLTIDQGALTLRVANALRKTQTPNPSFSYGIEGLKNGESPSLVTGVVLSTNANIFSLPGRYAITASGGVALNYLVTNYINGELTISTNNIPNTVEQTLSGSDKGYMQFEPLFEKNNQEQWVWGQGMGRPEKVFSIISDEEAQSSENMKSNALIFLTESLRELFGVSVFN